MKPFVFRLQTAMDMKIHQEEQKKEELERATRLYRESLDQWKSLQLHLEWVQGELREKQIKTVAVDEIKTCQEFIPVLLKRIAKQTEEVEQREQELNLIRAALVEIMKERKILEKIKSRNYQDYLRQALLEEQKQIDEMATNRFFRRDNPD